VYFISPVSEPAPGISVRSIPSYPSTSSNAVKVVSYR
jgi:hypothetical protein